MGLLIICSRYKIAKTDITFSNLILGHFRAFCDTFVYFWINVSGVVGTCLKFNNFNKIKKAVRKIPHRQPMKKTKTLQFH